jgi:hypothetical protein
MLETMRHPDGSPKLVENVWSSSLGTHREEKFGQLQAGFGAGRKAPKIGPELTFGIHMQEHHKESILIIKTSWGGKSLGIDFRPPGAGIHPAFLKQQEELKKENQDPAQVIAEYQERTGHYYRLMTEHAHKVLGDIKRVYPEYDAAQGYELAGFVWFQGCNDFGDTSTYPNAGQPGGYDEYSRLLSCMIRDLRKEFKTPKMPAVIGVLGINGELESERFRQIEPHHVGWLREFRKAMAVPVGMPEFKGQVAAAETKDFGEPRLEELQGRWKHVKAKSNDLKKQDYSLARSLIVVSSVKGDSPNFPSSISRRDSRRKRPSGS